MLILLCTKHVRASMFWIDLCWWRWSSDSQLFFSQISRLWRVNWRNWHLLMTRISSRNCSGKKVTEVTHRKRSEVKENQQRTQMKMKMNTRSSLYPKPFTCSLRLSSSHCMRRCKCAGKSSVMRNFGSKVSIKYSHWMRLGSRPFTISTRSQASNGWQCTIVSRWCLKILP